MVSFLQFVAADQPRLRKIIQGQTKVSDSIDLASSILHSVIKSCKGSAASFRSRKVRDLYDTLLTQAHLEPIRLQSTSLLHSVASCSCCKMTSICYMLMYIQYILLCFTVLWPCQCDHCYIVHWNVMYLLQWNNVLKWIKILVHVIYVLYMHFDENL